jgi:hypothetical protein
MSNSHPATVCMKSYAYRAGRRLGSSYNARDVTSLFARASGRVAIKRLDQFDRRTGEWREVLVESRTAGPGAARIDYAAWLCIMSRRQRAGTLVSGESTGATAQIPAQSRPDHNCEPGSANTGSVSLVWKPNGRLPRPDPQAA